ncbi:Fur family transcriptional regulator [Lichenihabitans psoromatis]|uniref:Fur family transcriptional regulator n=1 Tax=Lichenihabitans psoromatis TaxID=2528642 RepID=UPI0010382DCA|nr:Fur family transcriptional regulator [Lichenihabitans psoromatis]
MSTSHVNSHEPKVTGGWLHRVEELCGKRGLQLTALRRQVTEILARAPASLTAYEIIDELGRVQGRQIGPPTVYRTLDFLTENGFVVKIESRNAFARCDCPGHHHHGALLICSTCGRTDEIDSDALDGVLRSVATDSGFTIKRQMVELEGLCDRCRPAV